MKRKTVNQLLEQLYERFSWEEINKNSKIKKLKDKLFNIKLTTVNGGKVWIENTDEISKMLL
ncbi:MAG: hypothetical protein RBR47_12490 [Bacteroidales bacterium]|jgi:hypothetical protein|nr:hypothetical protein [Bacteroidales bacterium]NCU35891.1 hypothetical protein [Candidatus Falkowbacteria bacterium]MDD2633189.1 hypothetical protein [Bacteroidales bacterium]MDD3132027.1 hypothetical protein [Bacteroidales bacterium]MDD3527857.1 hypothetical protein [Bacteroidales bacterium]